MTQEDTALLNTTDLVQAYSIGTSAYRLAKNHGVSIWSILKRLREAGVEIRPDGVRKTLGLSLEAARTFRELTDGLLLGDGSISKKKPSLRIEQSERREDWLKDLERRFAELGVPTGSTNIPGRVKQIQGREVVKTPSRVIYLPLCEEVRAERDRWYPGDLKRVPRDLVLTPLTLAQWFCGDGTHDQQGFLYFCTNGFVREDVEWLAGEITDRFAEARCMPVGTHRPGEYKVVLSKRGEALALAEAMRPHMPACCLYKLRFVREPYDQYIEGIHVKVRHADEGEVCVTVPRCPCPIIPRSTDRIDWLKGRPDLEGWRKTGFKGWLERQGLTPDQTSKVLATVVRLAEYYLP